MIYFSDLRFDNLRVFNDIIKIGSDEKKSFITIIANDEKFSDGEFSLFSDCLTQKTCTNIFRADSFARGFRRDYDWKESFMQVKDPLVLWKVDYYLENDGDLQKQCVNSFNNITGV